MTDKKLTEWQVSVIRRVWAEGPRNENNFRWLTKHYGLRPQLLMLILKGQSYKEIKPYGFLEEKGEKPYRRPPK